MGEDIIIHPRKGKRESDIPENGLFLVTPAEARWGQDFHERNGGKRQFLYHSGLSIAKDGTAFIAGPAIGAPIATMTMEKLIALGARSIILFGWCGAVDPALSVGDLVVGAQAFSGEGTSLYYAGKGMNYPSEQLVTSLCHRLRIGQFAYQHANIWSTDAPYREDRGYITRLYQASEVRCVDMEYSALCAVAAFRRVDFAALFLVSDELYRDTWKPGYTSKEFREKSKILVRFLAEKIM